MKRRSLGLAVSLIAVSQLLAHAAHAQTPPPGYPTYPYYPAPPPVAAPPAGQPNMQGPILKLETDQPEARLQQLQLRWTDVCTAPCDRAVDPGAFYRIGGGSVSRSDPFQLPRRDGTVTVKAKTGSVVKKWVGFGMGIGGAVAAAYGGIIFLFGSAFSDASTGDNTGFDNSVHDLGRTYKIIGGACLLGGAALMAVGFPMMASQRTTVEVK